MILPCLGVSLAWYGFIPAERPHAATTGSFSIDGQSAISFPLKGITEEPASSTHYQKFFETTTLPYGHHNITVTFQGNEQTTPLTLDYLVVQNGTAPESLSTSSSLSGSSSKDAGSSSTSPPGPPPGSPPGSSPTGKNTGSNVNDTSSKSNVGIIVGGVVGSVGLILLVCLLLLCYRWKHKQQNLTDKKVPATHVEPFLGEGAHQHSTTALPNHSMWGRTHLLTSYGTPAYQIMPTKLRQEMQAPAAVAQPLRPQRPANVVL